MEELLNRWLEKAITCRADDIHITPTQSAYEVAVRQVNTLRTVEKLSLVEGSKVVRFIKYTANMEVGEKRRPQDGAMVFQRTNGERIELRISTIANYMMRESVVIRLLYQEPAQQSEDNVFNPDVIEKLFQYMQRQSGLLLFSGPVSSGKTTTIYRLLRQSYAKKKQQIVTIEDPIEIKEPHFLQTEINVKAEVDYDQLIRASLRHHPDILVIGEVRTEHTARMMIRAALTGHLVIATIHAKDTQGVIGRLQELGVSKEQLLQTLLAVTSQRLVPCIGKDDVMVIFELLDGKDLYHVIMHRLTSLKYTTLNQNLMEAMADGYISEETWQHYQIEENTR